MSIDAYHILSIVSTLLLSSPRTYPIISPPYLGPILSALHYPTYTLHNSIIPHPTTPHLIFELDQDQLNIAYVFVEGQTDQTAPAGDPSLPRATHVLPLYAWPRRHRPLPPHPPIHGNPSRRHLVMSTGDWKATLIGKTEKWRKRVLRGDGGFGEGKEGRNGRIERKRQKVLNGWRDREER